MSEERFDVNESNNDLNLGEDNNRGGESFIIDTDPYQELKQRQTITEVSSELNTKENTLRKYERDYGIEVPRDELGRRYYTKKEIAVFRQIIKLKSEGANIHVIKKILAGSLEAHAQKTSVLMNSQMEKLTPGQLGNALIIKLNELMEEREEKLKEYFSQTLEDIQEENQQRLEEQEKNYEMLLEKQGETIASKIQEQNEANNLKLIELAKKMREEEPKGFLSKLFGKKNKGE